MPTISQLPNAAQSLSTADYIPVDQNVSGTFTTGKINLGALLSLLAASSMLPPGIFSGSGAPSAALGGGTGDSYINVQNGDLWQYASGSGWSQVGSLVGPTGAAGPQGPAGPTYSITGQSPVSSMAGTDLLGISQGGADHTITLANALNGETINEGGPAQPASSTDTFWCGQGGSSMVVQTLAALWVFIARQFPTYFLPVIELTANVTLDGSIHNGKLLICSQQITVTAGGTMGSGFSCALINMSSGTVNLAGFTTSSGSSSLTPGQSANIYVAAYSLGTVKYAVIAGGASTPPPEPGSPSGLTAGATTASTVPLSWTAPGSGGAPASYTVQYRVTNGGSWTQVSGISGTSYTVAGLSASTQYDFQVQAVNAGGVSAWTPTTNAATAAGTVPGVPTNLTAGSPTSSNIALSWTAPSQGGVGATYNVQYQLQSGGSWTQISNVSGTSYTVTGLAASTTYNFEVQAVNGGLQSAWTAAVSEATTAATNYKLTAEVPTATTTYTVSQGGIPVATNDNSTSADGSYTSPVSVGFGWSTSNTVAPSSFMQASGPTTTDNANGITGALYGHNIWYQWISAPASAGTYYLWAVGFDAANMGGSQIANVVSPFSFTVS